MDITQRRISRIAQMVRTFTNRSMRREGVGPSELDLLLAVRFHPGITLTEVCRHLELDKGAAARQLAMPAAAWAALARIRREKLLSPAISVTEYIIAISVPPT